MVRVRNVAVLDKDVAGVEGIVCPVVVMQAEYEGGAFLTGKIVCLSA